MGCLSTMLVCIGVVILIATDVLPLAGVGFLLVIIGLIPVSASIFWATIWAFISSLRSRLASD